MDPGRQAMIEGWKSPRQRDITSPRRDPNNRISKPSRPSSNLTQPSKTSSSRVTTYLSQDEQSRRFVADEDKFVLKQAKKKADIRVREGRAKAIDYLAFNLRFVDTDRDVFEDDDADVDINVPAPVQVLEALGEAELKELESDITSYYTLESNARNREYWTALLALCKDRRQRLQPQGPEGRAVSTVAADVDRILSPKSLAQLEALEKQIRAKLQSNEPIDTDYWEQLLKSLLVWKAKARLAKVYEEIMKSRIDMLRDKDPEGAKALEEAGRSGFAATAGNATTSRAKTATTAAARGTSSTEDANPPPGTARFATTRNEDFSQATKALYDREVARGVGEDEEIFTAEEAVPSMSKPLWADKYRPRKPRYFNRVQMGYDWNKYNQTHYDHDNPPPKVVQGYKFNIFYPDLIDKTKAPTYKIIREGGRRRGESFAPAGEEDTCLIRFIAGPPYEDIAFRIVDREWDYSAKKERGFKSSFEKGILQLHFQFKKIYYRK
ncbi:Cactin [Pleurostoma richardsiae]|uniref:Splicing factor Cactin n=1 Tax=Pleurostoma richardsiae TaxID=41990 RepID=A0AA38VDJ0_9PEZI|nr:Cactin [Pleurostoma richardsiae]